MIFIDTGAFLARYIQRDQFHNRAIPCWQKLQKERRRCFTSNLVLNETITLLARRTTYEFAMARARNFFDSTFLTILRSDANDEFAALVLFEKLSDQKVSFTDCISFILMQKHHIGQAFTFDRHFVIAEFQVEP